MAMQENFFSVQENRKEYVREQKLYQVEFMLTDKCGGGCNYCVTFSDLDCKDILKTERVYELIDEAYEMGVKGFQWAGGDPLLHPDWFELISYALEKGMTAGIWTSGLVSKRDAKRIIELYNRFPETYEVTGVHIDTINQEVYNKVNDYPDTLQQKIQGYRNLLEAGFPAEKIMPSPTLSKPVCEVFDETLDWYIDEMGIKEVSLCPYRARGHGDRHRDFEPSLSDLRKVHEYLAKRLGGDWLKIGTTPLGTLYCRSSCCIWADGNVLPCGVMYDVVAGNIYQDSLKNIFEKNKDLLLFTGTVTGPCGVCENSEYCFGCRGNAYAYLGDMYASDPKCWLNPEAKENYYSTYAVTR